MFPKTKACALLCVFLTLCLGAWAQTPGDLQIAKPATKYTKDANRKVLNELPFRDTTDYANARRGWLLPFNTVVNSQGEIVNSAVPAAWNMAQYAFEYNNANDTGLTVNPSLWRQAQLNNFAGFFEVIPEKVYQVRGMDLSVMTLIVGSEDGRPCWIAIDPMVTAPASKAALSLANSYLQQKGRSPMKVRAVIYTHSHIDHYGGVLGVVSKEEINSRAVHIYAPEAFLEHAVTENLMAGTAMGRRATYMYGNLLFDKSPLSEVDAGLGKTTSSGPNSIIRPDTADIIPSWAKISRSARRHICGVTIDFWYTPETEAPAEMMFYFPEWDALCASELVTHTMHNVYSLRGAAVRDALSWSGYINDVIQTYGGTIQVIFASHHWPTWGNPQINRLLQKQRDLYKYLNDQTFRLFNQGYTMIEIGERVKLPDSLAMFWANRPYYGTVNHNVKALYQRSLGWFDGNPANLHPLPPQEAGVKYVEYMGGSKKLLEMAMRDFGKGEYRWVATAVNHLVFAEPTNMKARLLLADTYEQLGYQAESGPWRNFYLTGARELRNPKRVSAMRSLLGDPIPNDTAMSQMSPTDYFQYLAIHLDGLRAGSKNYTFQVRLTNDVLLMATDENPVWAKLELTNGVMNAYVGPQYVNVSNTNVPTIHITQSTMFDILTDASRTPVKVWQESKSPENTIFNGGEKGKLEWLDFLSMLERFEFWFNIVEP